jgi:hypothetical protein
VNDNLEFLVSERTNALPGDHTDVILHCDVIITISGAEALGDEGQIKQAGIPGMAIEDDKAACDQEGDLCVFVILDDFTVRPRGTEGSAIGKDDDPLSRPLTDAYSCFSEGEMRYQKHEMSSDGYHADGSR